MAATCIWKAATSIAAGFNLRCFFPWPEMARRHYRTVLTHGFMVDADREKISKSKQGRAVTKSRKRPKPM